MDRRRLLVGTGTVFSAGVAAYLVGPEAIGEFTGGSGEEIDPTTQLGEAEAISIEAEPEREYQYLESEDAVRVIYDRGTTTMPFADWGTRRATSAAASHVYSMLDDEGLIVNGIGVGITSAPLDELDATVDESEFDREIPIGVSVSHTTLFSWDGDLVLEPRVDYDAIIQTSPRSVEVTMLFEERDYTATLPVICSRSKARQT